MTTAALVASALAPYLTSLCTAAAEPAGKKRKADSDAAATPKKAKQADGSAANVDASAAQGSRTIFCKNLPWSATEDDLAGFFADCGTVVEVRLGECLSLRDPMLCKYLPWQTINWLCWCCGCVPVGICPACTPTCEALDFLHGHSCVEYKRSRQVSHVPGSST